MHIRTEITVCILCVFLLSACGNRLNTMEEDSPVAYERVDETARVETEQTETESLAQQSFSQSVYLPIGEADWEAYQEILSGEEYAALQKFFPILRAAIPFRWTVDAYTYENNLDLRNVTLEEFCHILNSELWDAGDDELRLDSIAFCDLDQDGELELVLALNNIGGYYLILKEEDGLYYGTDRVYRGFEDLRDNGVYVGSEGANYNYVYRMIFEEGAFREVLLGYESQGNYHIGDEETAAREVYLEWLDSVMSQPVVYHSAVPRSYDDMLYVDISTEEEYRAFIQRLEANPDCWYVALNMQGSDTAVYLDDLLASRRLTHLDIRNGGRVTARDVESLEGSLDDLLLWRITALDEGVLRRITVYDTLLLSMDQKFQGKPPVENVLDNTLCRNIILVRDDRWESGAMSGLLTENEIPASISREWDAAGDLRKAGGLMGIYRLNEGEYIYTDFDFYKPDSLQELCGAFISVRDRESGGNTYFDILEIPPNRLSGADMRDTQRIHRLGDLNFDGFRDIVFIGSGIEWERYNACTVFLWNELKQRYEFCESAPEDFLWPQQDKDRLIRVEDIEDIWDNEYREEYYIYEYDGSAFTTRMLEVNFMGEGSIEHVNWRYFEEGELKETLTLLFDENSGRGHISHAFGGITQEELLDQEEVYYREVGMKYFPEFDFYIYG